MELNQFTDYALRALIYLAVHPDKPHPTSKIASDYQISVHHLSKVMQRLAELGYVETHRGRYGGATLARHPRDISVGTLVRELEPLQLVECFAEGQSSCAIASSCGLKRALIRAQKAFLHVLDGYHLQDLARSPKSLRALLSSQV